jgi:hypothetical protein
MKLSCALLVTAYAGVAGAGGYLTTKWLQSGPREARAGQAMPEMTPPVSAARAAVPARPGLAPAPSLAAASAGLAAAVSDARPIVLPKLGSFDLQSAGNMRMQTLRKAVARHVRDSARIACGRLDPEYSAVVSLMVPLRVSGGALEVSPISEVEVSEGAPMKADLLRCFTGLISEQFVLPPPAGAEKWIGVTDGTGITVVTFPTGKKRCD